MQIWKLIEDISQWHPMQCDDGKVRCAAIIRDPLLEEILEKQKQSPEYEKMISESQKEDSALFQDDDGSLWFNTRIWVPDDIEVKDKILHEAHKTKYTIHPGSTKMYQNIKKFFWWPGMKKDVAEYVARCLVCQQIKAEHQKPGGLMQQIEIPLWKWEDNTMDFVVGFPRTRRQRDAIWVIVDRLTKSAHFLPIQISQSLESLADLYVREIIRLHGVPKSIISDRDPRFTSRFWTKLQEALGTKLKLSTAFHPQTDGQSERTIQTLEAMLRACVLEWKGEWDKHIMLAEFAYNNSFYSNIRMTPFEALYGRPCRSPTNWTEIGDNKIEDPLVIQYYTEQVDMIRKKLLAAQSRQKSYADRRRRELVFGIGDHVFIKIAQTKSVFRFGKKGKLSPQYIGPFDIVEKVGDVAYRVALPPQYNHIHPVFHVSMLRKYVPDPTYVIDYEDIEVQEDLSMEERPLRIIDRKEHVLQNKTIPWVQVEWKHHGIKECTWEPEQDMKDSYPQLFR
ncbi:unnamed protein product [Victoria cruziana]